MGKYTGILLCSDLDGTLFNGEEIPKRNIAAIRYFAENGGMFSPASGRPILFLRELFDSIGYSAPVIALNGAYIYDVANETEIKKTYMSGLERSMILNVLDAVPYLQRANFHTSKGHIKLLPDELRAADPSLYEEVFKVTFNLERSRETSDAAKAKIREIVPEYFEIVRSSLGCIEIVDPRNTKEKATRLVADYVHADKLVCVGDFENDISMVRNADIGYAVANATDDLKAVADRITVSVDEGAIAAIIEEL